MDGRCKYHGLPCQLSTQLLHRLTPKLSCARDSTMTPRTIHKAIKPLSSYLAFLLAIQSQP
nr:MAG TPA: hypothetical protein [Caudoviricetes sp.]